MVGRIFGAERTLGSSWWNRADHGPNSPDLWISQLLLTFWFLHAMMLS